MSMPKGKYVNIDVRNPEALGMCDYSNFVGMRKDLVRQMEWRGDGLVWTGLLVNRVFADIPNEQGRSPILPPDPIPIVQARPQFIQYMTWSNNPLPTWSLNTYFPLASLDNNEGGVLASSEAQRVESLQNYYWSPV